jgi:ABC-2 type transport system permease protein
MKRCVMDRLLASPVRRGATMIGTLAYQAAVLISVIVASLSNALACSLASRRR